MNPRIPEPVRPLLQAYLSMVGGKLPGLLYAFYLEGSIALGGFNERFSDIDFLAILDRPATPGEVDLLRSIHAAIDRRYPRRKMMGPYLQLSDLRRLDRRAAPHPACHDGVLRSGAQFELDSVEGWILAHHGITLLGPEPRELPLTVDWGEIVRKMRLNLNTYWARWVRRPDKMAIMLSDWGIQWTVLGVLRQFYSFREHTITTKVGAGRYALGCLPARWRPLIQEAIRIRDGNGRPLIQEAIRIRDGNGRSLYRSRIVRAGHAVRFLRIMIDTCNANAAP
ncbi:MAG: DUF4111 domain-containing protein [Anaerolineae bacterium]|nr:DUF4111 domain-containing protein [Anaerolineae bacterium]